MMWYSGCGCIESLDGHFGQFEGQFFAVLLLVHGVVGFVCSVRDFDYEVDAILSDKVDTEMHAHGHVNVIRFVYSCGVSFHMAHDSCITITEFCDNSVESSDVCWSIVVK